MKMNETFAALSEEDLTAVSGGTSTLGTTPYWRTTPYWKDAEDRKFVATVQRSDNTRFVPIFD